MSTQSMESTGPEEPSPGGRSAEPTGDEADVRTADLPTITAQAPPFRAPVDAPPPGGQSTRDAIPGTPETHPDFEDFEVLRVLGKGSFGTVYLARQVSLERQVALKVTANRGSEARTLASLEHDHIVHVFSETVDLVRNQRMLCMQYVAGTTLDRIIRALSKRDRNAWSGQAIVEAIDSLSQHPAVFHPAALRDRELLAEADYYQAVCWIGARMAEALDYAHARGVLHRDIKPANILVSQYGRPLLADFNISLQAARNVQAEDDVFGGTLGYMAPEHLDAFNPDDDTPRDAVDERSDIYSLGIVLFEMLTGRGPFDRPAAGLALPESLRALSAARRGGVPSPRRECSDVPEVLDRIDGRCLHPDPQQRYQSGAELARALEGCRELRGAVLDLPAPGPLTIATLRRPFLFTAILALLPHMLGSVVNISYNAIQVVGRLSDTQRSAFGHVVLGYNVLVYPACVWLLCLGALPVFRLVRQLADGQPVDPARFDDMRKRVLRWPPWVVGLSCLGWLPGGLVFPGGISLLADPVGPEIYLHFLISFTISGLIALTYSFFGVQYVALRVFYPRLWGDARHFRQRSRAELAGIGPQLRLFQVLAGSIPLAGAVLLVGVGAEVSAYLTFRILVTGLIALGMAGFVLAVHSNNLIVRSLAAFTGTEGRRGAGS